MKVSKIEWTHSTFNPWWGCEKVSRGCTHCYAETFARRTGHDVWGGTADRRFFGDKHWNEPLRWNEEAAKSSEPWRVFCASMADVFEDRRDLDVPRDRVFDLIERTPHLTWLLLTKRPENMVRLAPARWCLSWPLNAWAGSTIENRANLGRLDELRRVPSSTLWLSLEPLVEDLGDVDLRGIAWAIIGGESGAQASPMDLAWVRSLLRQMRAQDVAALVKQFGRGRPMHTVHGRGHHHYDDGVIACVTQDPKGGDESEWPEEFRVREYPKGRR